MNKNRQSVIEQMESVKALIGGKLNTEGYVVAGQGGDTYYAYIGEGKGFKGAALQPVAVNPVVFNTERAAMRVAYNGTYRNGRNDVIRLEAVKATDYFAKIYANAEKNIET